MTLSTSRLLAAALLGGSLLLPGSAGAADPPPSAATPQLSALTYRLAPDLVACGQPSRADFEALRATGYRTVLNLRADGEKGYPEGQSALLKELGLREIRIPLTYESLDAKGVDAFRAAVKDPANRPLVIHCGSSNRVGMLFAILAVLDDGKSLEEAEKIGREAGMTKDDARAAFLAYVAKAKGAKG